MTPPGYVDPEEIQFKAVNRDITQTEAYRNFDPDLERVDPFTHVSIRVETLKSYNMFQLIIS